MLTERGIARLDVQPTEQTQTVTVPQIPFDKYIIRVYTACTYCKSTYNSLQILRFIPCFLKFSILYCFGSTVVSLSRWLVDILFSCFHLESIQFSTRDQRCENGTQRSASFFVSILKIHRFREIIFFFFLETRDLFLRIFTGETFHCDPI